MVLDFETGYKSPVKNRRELGKYIAVIYFLLRQLSKFLVTEHLGQFLNFKLNILWHKASWTTYSRHFKLANIELLCAIWFKHLKQMI